MPPATQRTEEPPGILRVLVLFHEPQLLGAGISVLRVTDELAAYGWTVSGWAPGAGALTDAAKQQLALVDHAERPVAFSLRGWREPPGPLARGWRSRGYLRAVRGAIERVRPHVIHANTLLSLPEARVARGCGLPVVLQSHEIPARGAKTTVALRLAAETADVLVGVSDAASDVLRAHARSTPVVTVRNGVPTAPESHQPGTAEVVVGTVGTVSRTKGTDVFIRAARLALEQRPNMRFEHVGAPDLHRDAGFDDELARLRHELPAGALTMLGTVPAADVVPRWDVFVSTSRSEAFPLAILEAMASGKAVVAPTVGGIPEQLDHLESGVLVRPDDPEAVATWLIRLHDEVELRQRLGSAARRRALAEFTLQKQAEGLHRAYLMAVARRFGPPRVRRAVEAAS